LKAILPIVAVLALGAAFVLVLRPALFPGEARNDGLADPAPPSDDRDPAAAGAEQAQIGRMLAEARGVLDEGDAAGLRAILAKAGVDLEPDREREVLAVLGAHLDELRENLEQARVAAPGPGSRGTDHQAVAAQVHGRMLKALQAVVGEGPAVAIFKACPPMIPPTFRPPPSAGGQHR
jgi:ribosomal protein L12E/L44/L45/RPP1/RPP2